MTALNAWTNAVTAFPTWAEFAAAMENGYCPTIHPRTRRSRLLIRAVVAAGFLTWPTKPVHVGHTDAF